MTQPLYAVGDIHGHKAEMDKVLEWIATDGGPEAEIVFLGDFVDRGPDSRGVIQALIDATSAGKPWHVLRGNHDRMFCRYVDEGILHDSRILSGKGYLHPALGGLETLKSYGIDAIEGDDPFELLDVAQREVPQAHTNFLASRDLTLVRDGKLFVHAGIMPGKPLEDQIEDDLVWIRGPFLDYTDPHPWLVVHGHTALEAPQHFGNRIDLDGGAGYGRPLHAAVFEGDDVWCLTDEGRQPLLP
ncbi:MAG: serine/threonine protein phosphatase [Rhodobacteraceae bacterium]|nr:serine/threonine protein phosphatase [Paracoccaceae bacterium]MAY44490.1 serine/threonine protein phosphatase [Paracoccaceae bacterium]QEW18195.1 phosphatase PrpE [Marinibacterium anthonyi]